MKTILTIAILFVTLTNYGQSYSGAMKILIKEKVKGPEGSRPLVSDSITIVLNDSATYHMTTDKDGYAIIKNLTKGKYTVKATRMRCQALEFKGILIGEGKTSYISFHLTCTSYINSLTKREKKKLGYK